MPTDAVASKGDGQRLGSWTVITGTVQRLRPIFDDVRPFTNKKGQLLSVGRTSTKLESTVKFGSIWGRIPANVGPGTVTNGSCCKTQRKSSREIHHEAISRALPAGSQKLKARILP